MTPAPEPYPRQALEPMRLKPLLGATTRASVAGRPRSRRKYSKTVGLAGAGGEPEQRGLPGAAHVPGAIWPPYALSLLYDGTANHRVGGPMWIS